MLHRLSLRIRCTKPSLPMFSISRYISTHYWILNAMHLILCYYRRTCAKNSLVHTKQL
jgi:hypothetical protein